MMRKALYVLLLFLVVLAVLIGRSYHRDMVAARARVSSGSKVVSTPCGAIEYADRGAGPVVFAIHGAGGGFDQSLELAGDFLSPGWRVVAPSRFGYLHTPVPADASPAAQANAHACLLDALGLQKVIVVGGSMGAPSAMQLCLRHPDRCSALVLLFPIAYAPRPEGEPVAQPSGAAQFLMKAALKSDFIFWAASKVARNGMIRAILATPPEDFYHAGPEEQERVLRILDHVSPISGREKGLMNDAGFAMSPPRYDLEHITVPTLVISAEDDLFATYKGGRYTAEHIPGAHFVGYPTGGHLLVGHKTEVRRELDTFLHLISPAI
jgi:2-hydroxy-6-oxonona-2,4-dienedioate hydrolase